MVGFPACQFSAGLPTSTENHPFSQKKTRNICNLEAPTETEPVTEDLDQVGILRVPFFRCHLLYLVMVVMSLLMVLEIPQAPVEQ